MNKSMKNAYQIEFTPTALTQLEKVQKKDKAETKAKTVIHAVSVYEYLLDRMAEGYSIQIEKNGIARELDLARVKSSCTN